MVYSQCKLVCQAVCLHLQGKYKHSLKWGYRSKGQMLEGAPCVTEICQQQVMLLIAKEAFALHVHEVTRKVAVLI